MIEDLFLDFFLCKVWKIKINSIFRVQLEQTSLLRQKILKIIRARSNQNKLLFIGLDESSHHGKTKILKLCPFLENFIPLSPCYY